MDRPRIEDILFATTGSKCYYNIRAVTCTTDVASNTVSNVQLVQFDGRAFPLNLSKDPKLTPADVLGYLIQRIGLKNNSHFKEWAQGSAVQTWCEDRRRWTEEHYAMALAQVAASSVTELAKHQ